MMRSLFSGVAGLTNHQTAMDVIGANISNVNTVGYKAGRSNFSDVISQTLQGASASTDSLGGTNPIQVGLGMGLAAVDIVFTTGSYQSTGKQTDLAIQNDGFFILSDGTNQYYTRAGNFDFDSTGNYLVPGTGMKVMGWQADVNGSINTTGPVTSIQVPKGTMMPALATTELSFSNNLSGDELPGSSAVSSLSVYDSLGNAQDLGQTFTKISSENNVWLAKASLADTSIALSNPLTEITFDSLGKNPTVRQVAATATTALSIPQFQLDNVTGSVHDQYYTVFDSGLNPHVLQMSFTQTSSNNWTYTLGEAGTANSAILLSGSLAWDSGTSSYVFSPAMPQTFDIGSGSSLAAISFNNPVAHVAPGSETFVADSNPTYTTSTTVNPVAFTSPGASETSISLNVSALTQYGGSSTVQATTQNGYASGNLDSLTIDTTGTLVGKFSNGRTQNLGQVALATFNNPGGLIRIGDTLFSTSNNSGNPSVGTSGTGGRGSLTPGSLEMSNVDLADQFSKMIITQRGFQANSKIITTSDTMLEELVNLKR